MDVEELEKLCKLFGAVEAVENGKVVVYSYDNKNKQLKKRVKND